MSHEVVCWLGGGGEVPLSQRYILFYKYYIVGAFAFIGENSGSNVQNLGLVG